MGLNMYEMITGYDALKYLAENVKIYPRRNGDDYYLIDVGGYLNHVDVKTKYTEKVELSVDEIIKNKWYIKHFDIRAEMLARPYEWVGAYENEQGTWFKVGFDMRSMVAVKTNLPYLRVANFGDTGVSHVAENDLDRCIPIEDVPVYVPNLN